jgi:hypothetical protein
MQSLLATTHSNARGLTRTHGPCMPLPHVSARAALSISCILLSKTTTLAGCPMQAVATSATHVSGVLSARMRWLGCRLYALLRVGLLTAEVMSVSAVLHQSLEGEMHKNILNSCQVCYPANTHPSGSILRKSRSCNNAVFPSYNSKSCPRPREEACSMLALAKSLNLHCPVRTQIRNPASWHR